MITVREGTFETNSSSSHNIVIVEDSQFEKWKNGDLFYVERTREFVSKYSGEREIDKEYGKLVLEYADDERYADEIAEAIKEKRLKEYVKERIDYGDWYLDTYEIPLSYEEWQRVWENRELEEDETTYTTPNGETIHIFCQYGYDG